MSGGCCGREGQLGAVVEKVRWVLWQRMSGGCCGRECQVGGVVEKVRGVLW